MYSPLPPSFFTINKEQYLVGAEVVYLPCQPEVPGVLPLGDDQLPQHVFPLLLVPSPAMDSQSLLVLEDNDVGALRTILSRSENVSFWKR